MTSVYCKWGLDRHTCCGAPIQLSSLGTGFCQLVRMWIEGWGSWPSAWGRK